MKQKTILTLLLMAAFTTTAFAQAADDNEPTDFYFVDGVDFGEFGSYIPLEYLIRPSDWRGRQFSDHTTYWDYYGVTDIYTDLATAECNLGGTWQPLPATLDVSMDKIHLSGFYQLPDKADGTVTSRFGFLTYKNNGTVVQSDFQIRFYVSMDYKWGTFVSQEKITTDVKSTFVTGIDPLQTSPRGGFRSLPLGGDGRGGVDLQGRRVNGPLQKGIYIQNGKKVVMK